MPSKSLAEMKAMVGDSVRTVRNLAVEAGMVAEFTAALRDDRALFRREEDAAARGYPAIPAPLTFTRVAYFPRYRPSGIDENLGFDLGFDPGRVVHGEQTYRFERPVRVGDTLTGTTTLRDISQRTGGNGGTLTFAELETAFRTVNGELVLTATNTRIERGLASDDEDDTAGDGPDDDGGQKSPAGGNGGDGGEWKNTVSGVSEPTPPWDLDPGEAGPTLVVENVDRTDFVKYAGASGDFNPLHFSDPYARAAGYDQVIGQGMLTAGFAARLATDWFGVAGVDTFGTQFRDIVRPGDTLTVSSEVSEAAAARENADEGDGLDSVSAAAELTVTRDDGVTVLDGKVTGSPAGGAR